MLRERCEQDPSGVSAGASPPPLLEPLLAVHSAPNVHWLADAAATTAERGLGALFSILYLTDSSGRLVGQRPASTERMRPLARARQALDVDLTALAFLPQDRQPLAAALREGHALAVANLDEALPLAVDVERLRAAQRRLGVAEVWLAPLWWSGASPGLLLLLMPAEPNAQLLQAELLAGHIAVALSNLRERETARKQGELDTVRWVHDERRFLEQLTNEIRRAQRHRRPLSVMLVRVLHLHELNARYGRFLAQRVLRQIAGRLADAMRDTDFLGAFGADGFAAILVETDMEGAGRAKERLLAGLGTVRFPYANLPEIHLELAGATATLPEDGTSAEDLATAAQARLAGAAEERRAA